MKMVRLFASCLAMVFLGGCAPNNAAPSSSPNAPESIEAKGRPMTAAERSAFHDVSPAAPAVAYFGEARVECSADHQAYLFVGGDRFHIADLSIMGLVWQTFQRTAQEKVGLQLTDTSLCFDAEVAVAIGGVPDLLTRLLHEGNHNAAILTLAQAWCRDGLLTWYARLGTDLTAFDVRLPQDVRQRLADSIALTACTRPAPSN